MATFKSTKSSAAAIIVALTLMTGCASAPKEAATNNGGNKAPNSNSSIKVNQGRKAETTPKRSLSQHHIQQLEQSQHLMQILVTVRQMNP